MSGSFRFGAPVGDSLIREPLLGSRMLQVFYRAIIVLAVVPGIPLLAAVKLPPESQLPPSYGLQTASLPGESQLPPPGHRAEATSLPNGTESETGSETHRELEPATPPAEPAPPVDFPATPAVENPAPQPAVEQPESPAVDDTPAADGEVDPLGLARSADGVPWLRLNLRGHTAPIRAVAVTPAGNRICTAGDDKSAVVWASDDAGRWRYERTIRWQVQRGTRGRIYALAAGPQTLAIAGEGAMGGTGEILLVDPASGDLQATLFDQQAGHRQVVVAMDFFSNEERAVLASQSMDGRTLLWKKDAAGVWRPTVLIPDDKTAGREDDLAQRLLAARGFTAVTALDDHRVIVPTYSAAAENRVLWELSVYDAEDGSSRPLANGNQARHWDAVTAMSADASRGRLASADGAGQVYLWDLQAKPPTVAALNRPGGGQAMALSFSGDGQTLAIATAYSASQRNAGVEIWDLSTWQQPRREERQSSPSHVMACALSADGGTLVASRGSSAMVRTLRGQPRSQTLRGATRPPLQVAFARDEPLYRLGIGTRRDDRGEVVIDQTFDTDQLRLTRVARQARQTWLPAEQGDDLPRVVESNGAQGGRVWSFEQAGVEQARLPLAESRNGGFSTLQWLVADEDDDEQRPIAAVGTAAGEILVVRATLEGEAPVLRRFRGHASAVVSLAVSRDQRWLASGSADSTVRVWPLAALDDGPLVNRWGATFNVDNNGRLRVATIREDGPLYFRGLRQGDELIACQWLGEPPRRAADGAADLLTALTESAWDRIVKFEYRSGQQAARQFQIHPAWQQVATLVVDSRGEWAYWAPAGYYDASFEGHRLFGWQVNRGLDQLPDFFLAAQFRQVLEKPAVMSRLLRAGTLEGAFRGAGAEPPDRPGRTLADNYLRKPAVEIVSPESGAVFDETAESRLLQAEIEVPRDQRVTRAKAFANGVVAPPGKLLRAVDTVDGRRLTYQWELAVPNDPQVMVQVVAAGDEDIVGVDQLVIANEASEPTRRARLMLLAVGIGDYRDAQIPNLRTPAPHALALTNLLRTSAQPYYRVEATSLLDDNATRSAWSFLTKTQADQLQREASADDLLVIYLSGHGVQDVDGDRYHFVTSDASFVETMAGSYGNCLSFEDFAHFANVSCRKLVILDTCHGGAIQPMRHREMKTAVRALQDDLLVTVAASQGTEEAVEGRFSSRLLEALAGAADRQDGDQDGVVRLDELIAYVERTVSEDSLGDAQTQLPSAGPTELLPYLRAPLTVVPADVRLNTDKRTARQIRHQRPATQRDQRYRQIRGGAALRRTR